MFLLGLFRVESKVGKLTAKTWLPAFACLFLPSLACAAGLGKLSVLSALGQPLKAEIDVVSLQSGEGDLLSARLASTDAFRQASIDLNPALLSVKFAIEHRARGQYVLTLRSVDPMNEPFVDMLVELNWSAGRLVREYTFLLDPIEYTGPAMATSPQAVPLAQTEPAAPPQAPGIEPVAPPGLTEPAASPAPSEASPATTEPAGSPQALPAEPIAPPQSQQLPAEALSPAPAQAETAAPRGLVEEPKETETYEVKRGDTLSKIAIRNRIEGATLQQMLVALLRANPDAFVKDNMNRLRAGKIIRLPGKEATESIAVADARRVVSAQFADFTEYRRSLGAAVAAAPAPQESGRQASGQVSPPKEEKPVPAKERPKDQLRLSSADEAKRGGKAAGTVAADDLAAKNKALKEAEERAALLDKNLKDLEKLAQVKSQAGAQLQQQAEAAKSAPAAKAAEAAGPKSEPTKAAETPKADADKIAAAPAKTPEAAKAPEPVKAPEAAKASEAAKSPEVVAKAPEAAKAAPAKATAKAPAIPPQVEVSFVDDLLDNPYALGGAGGAVILLVGYAAYAWRRKRGTQIGDSVMGGVSSDADSVLGSTGGRSVDTGSSSFQSDFSQEGIGKIDTEEIDPVAEADVYIAYGRDAQAEEILKDALAKDSGRQGIRLKLLEIYANRKDASAFEAEARDLHAATGGRGADWEKAANLGLSIDPANSLYGGRAGESTQGFLDTSQMVVVPPAGGPDTEPTLQVGAPLNIDFDIGTGGVTPPPDINLDIGTPSQAESAPAGLDFDLGLGGDKFTAGAIAGAGAHAAPAADIGLSIDFDLPLGEKPAAAASATPAAAETGGGIDFDIGLLVGGEAAKADAPQASALDLSAISLDLGAPGAGNGSGGAPDARWQEVATKLDLAKAYGEMGDKDGARELLKEVMKEGDAAQQQQAQTMLQALG